MHHQSSHFYCQDQMEHGPLPEYQKLAIRSVATELRKVNSEFPLTQQGTGSDAALDSSILHLSTSASTTAFTNVTGLGRGHGKKSLLATVCYKQQSPGMSRG